MDYAQSRKYIEQSQKYGSVLGLDTMKQMMERLGNPQEALSFVHIAGTNGKGSVLAYLYSILTHAGYRVGRYISPSVYSYREKMGICLRPISREDFAQVMTKVAQVAEEMAAEGIPHPTVFEMETAAALVWFAREGCSLVLLEAGMGGSLDATNIVTNTRLALWASISLDHMAYLGNNLAEIAQKKAGILKKDCLALSLRQQPEAMTVLEEACRAKGLSLHITEIQEARILEDDLSGIRFLWKGQEYKTPLAGVCQLQNAALALDALDLLGQVGFPTTPAQRREGLMQTAWPGRFSLLGQNPLFVVDGAHNPDAARVMEENIHRYLAGKRLIFLMGMFADKDYPAVLAQTAPYASRIYTIETPHNPRALPAEDLAAAARKYCAQVRACVSIREGVSLALQAAQEEDAILCFGSLSILSEVEKAYREEQEERKEGGVGTDREPPEVAPELLSYRNQIDAIDGQLVNLFEQRMKLSEEVASYKIRAGKPVLDQKREAKKLKAAADLAHGTFNRTGVRELFSQIMAISRKRQYQLLGEHKSLSASDPDLAGFRPMTDLPLQGAQIVFQGVEGAYSYAAMKQYFGSAILSPLSEEGAKKEKDRVCYYHVRTFADAMEEVSAGRADYAVLPIENSTAGIVADIYDLLMTYRLYILGQQVIRVDHVLLGLPNAHFSQIRKVYSHPQGLAQCREFLASQKDWNTVEAENTAQSARMVSAMQDPSCAAIASREAGDLYHLKVLKEDICANGGNETRFIIVGRTPLYLEGATTISICFELQHTSGSLYNMLSHIIYNGLNMTKIESRPIPGKNWEYRFFVDFEGKLDEASVENALRGIAAEANALRILGTY